MYTPQDWQSWLRRFFCLTFMIIPSGFVFFLSSSLHSPTFHPSIFAFPPPHSFTAHQYWPLSSWEPSSLPVLCTLACLDHRSDEINSPSSVLRKPVLALRERTQHSKWLLFEWAGLRKLLSYRFYCMVSVAKFKVNFRHATVSHPHIEFVDADKQKIIYRRSVLIFKFQRQLICSHYW